jgi:chemotaxis protein CheZ
MVLCGLRKQAGDVANQANQIQQAICTTIKADLAELRTFIDRRIAELSAEVHATVELMDFSEVNLSRQLASIHEQIAHIIALPTAATRNSGLELEAVVQATEVAANRIMEAAEAIADWLHSGSNSADERAEAEEKVNAIFEACSFQDLTGQRIRRAIQHLQQVEAMLTQIMPGTPSLPEPVVVSAPLVRPVALTPVQALADPDLGQDAIDTMFG